MFLNIPICAGRPSPLRPILSDYTSFRPLGKELNLLYNDPGMAGRADFTVGARNAGAPTWLFRLFPFLLFFLSFLPRLVAIGRYVTPDEPTWVYRSVQFREALLAGNWAGTLVAGHPGVITTWLGAIGASVHMLFSTQAAEAYSWLLKIAFLTPDNVAAFERLAVLLSSGRVAVALVNSLGVVVAYFLVRRLWGCKTAAVAGLLLALDPFLVGLSGLLHVDGLSATFVILSLLALSIGLTSGKAGGRTWVWPAAAGALAGLAALTKTPMLLLLPVSGLAMLWTHWRNDGRPPTARAAALLRDGIVWGAAFTAVILALFPALWVSPPAVLAMIGGSANRHLEEALRETFFLGRVAFDHGPLFYPITLLWRLSPIVWLALFPVAALLIERRKDGRGTAPGVYPVLLLLFWAILFLMVITPAAKKFDRYILPVVPALLVTAAVAWVKWADHDWRIGRRVLALAILGHVVYWLVYAAYPLAAYNPLAGGSRTAVSVLPAGWGEGIGAAGRWLTRTQPAAESERAIAGIVPALAPFFAGTTLVDGLDDPASANYTIVTLGGRQLNPAGWDEQIRGLDLAHVVRFGGLDQAWVYSNPSPVEAAMPPALLAPVTFGDRIDLTAYSQAVDEDVVTLAVRWRLPVPAQPDSRLILRMAIRDEYGNVWASQETDLLNEYHFYPADWPAGETGVVRYLLELPPGIPPASYRIDLSIIDAQTAGRLPVRVGEEGFQGAVFTAGEIAVSPPEQVVSASRLQVPYFVETTWLNGQLRLLGHGEIPTEVLAGSELPVDLFWHVPEGSLPAGLNLDWALRPLAGEETRVIYLGPLSRYDTGLWRVGETIQEKYRVPLPPDLSAGRYTLTVGPSDGSPLGDPQTLGEIQINNIDRLYEVDVPVPYLVSFGALDLLGLNTTELSAAPGESPELTLFWRKYAPHGEVFTVFVHLLDDGDNVVQYADHWPGGLPTDILDGGQIVIDRFPIPLPPDLPPGDYRIRVGLYSAESGARLPAYSFVEDGAGLVGEDYVILPLVLHVTSP